jgi:hypothetical protein
MTMPSKVRIYRPTKNAMQSGKANVKRWVVEFEQENGRFIEPLMGWTGISDTKPQVRLKFDTKAQAIDYVKKNGFEYDLFEPQEAPLKPKSYAANFQ